MQLCRSVQYVNGSKNVLRLNMQWQCAIPNGNRTAKKCTEIYNARAQLLFCSLNILFGSVVVAGLLKINKDQACVFAFVFLSFTLLDERIIVPPLLPPLLDWLKFENVWPLTRIAASWTEQKRSWIYYSGFRTLFAFLTRYRFFTANLIKDQWLTKERIHKVFPVQCTKMENSTDLRFRRLSLSRRDLGHTAS